MKRKKYISFLGASTSTFDGYTNNELYNSGLTGNKAYYPKPFLNDVNDTWWMKTIHALDLTLCVNNSWGGSCVTTKVDATTKAGCMDRATQLHNDRLGIEPDIIVLIIGGNDALRGYEVGTYNGVSDVFDGQNYIGDTDLFGQAYATMVHKVKTRYPLADIYVCSMLNWAATDRNQHMLPYNDVIKQIADEFHVTYVDFYHGTAIAPETKETYLHADGIHPTKAGFGEMSDCFVKALSENCK